MRISCVIPVFNEEATVAGVLAAVIDHPLVSEVIVVDDGSTDSTAAVVRSVAGVRLVSLGRNGGKSQALYEGIKEAGEPVILLLDGDLTGLTAAHVTALVRPVIRNEAEISISLRRNAPRLWRLIGLDYISGERALRRDLVAGHLEDVRRLPGFGFEVFLNGLCIERNCRIAVVILAGVDSPYKSSKLGLAKGLQADIGMIRDILSVISPTRIAAQIVALRRLRV